MKPLKILAIISLFLTKLYGMDPSRIHEIKEGLQLLPVGERIEATSVILKRCRRNLDRERINLEEAKKSTEEIDQELDRIEKESKFCPCCDSCILW